MSLTSAQASLEETSIVAPLAAPFVDEILMVRALRCGRG